MKCKYFQNEDVKRCIAFPKVFIPDFDIVNSYCNCVGHKFCPFHIKTTVHNDVSNIDSILKRVSIEI